MRSYLLPLPAVLLAGCSLSQPGFTPSNPEPVFFADEIEITEGGQCFGIALTGPAPVVAPVTLPTPAAELADVADVEVSTEVEATPIASDVGDTAIAEAPVQIDIPRRDPEIEALIATTQGGIMPADAAPITIPEVEVATAEPVVQTPSPLQSAATEPDAEIDLLIAATQGGSLIAEVPAAVLAPEMTDITGADVLYFTGASAGERFETLCPPAYSASFVTNLQRALQARDAYSGPISGLVDQETRDAIHAFQASSGAPNSPLIAVSTARELGLVPLSDEELAALNAGETQ